MRKTVLAATAAALAIATCNPANAQADPAQGIAAAVADPQRPAADTARDAERKPAEIVAFAGVKPGDKVAEFAPGGGYYTRILARAVGPEGHVTVVTADFTDFTLEEPVDVVWTTESYHDFNNGPAGNIDKINAAAFRNLKPGGIYFVEDHAAPGTGTSATSTLHRIDPAAVTSQVTAAGFTLEAESDLLHNPADPHDISPREVEPTSDKFALRFRKPG